MSEQVSQQVILSADLYSREALEESAEAFASLAQVRVEASAEGRELLVTVREAKEEVRDRLLDELLNHALEGTILRRRELEQGSAR